MPEASVDVARAVVAHLLVYHPLPWRVEHDWTYEVTTSTGHIVAKVQSEEEARQIVQYAELIGAEREVPMGGERTSRDLAAEHAEVAGKGTTVSGCDCSECSGKRAAARLLESDMAENYGRY